MMKPTTLTKTRFVQALECPRKLDYARDSRYRDARSDDEFMAMLAEGGHQVGVLARLMYPEGRLISNTSSDDQVAATAEALRAEEVTLFEATIRHGNLLVRCDVLRKRGTELKLIEVKAKGHDPLTTRFLSKRGHPILAEWKPYLYDVAFQAYVLELAYPALRVTPHLLLLDKSVTVRSDGLGTQLRVETAGRNVTVTVDASFDINTLSRPVLREIDVSREVAALRGHEVEVGNRGTTFEDLIAEVSGVLERGESFPVRVSPVCKRCQYYADPADLSDDLRSGWAECMTAARAMLPTLARPDTAFGLYSISAKALGELLAKHPLRLTEVPEKALEHAVTKEGEIEQGHRRYLQWQEATGAISEPLILRPALLAALRSWRWPLHFIDFETSRPALPYHAGRTPYDQILFQFSHHVLEEDGRLTHRTQHIEVTPGTAPSLIVLRALMQALSRDGGTVIHWWTHERTVLSEIREQIEQSPPADRDVLIRFIDSLLGSEEAAGRLQDLGRLVARTAFYPGTSGSSSIKKVLPAVLRTSPQLRRRYGQSVYGTPAMPSLNFRDWRWVVEADGRVRDPYELLDPLFVDPELQRVLRNLEDAGVEDGFIDSGGAALIAYDRLQQPSLGSAERQRLVNQLLRYCELDTLAMVMVYQSLTGHGLG